MGTAIVPATEADFVAVYGHRPRYSMQGYAVRQDGRAVAIGGLYTADRRHVVFSQITEPVSRKVIVQVCHKVMTLVRARGTRVFAIRDTSLPTSASLLDHFGFQLVTKTAEGEFYQWLG